MNSTSGIMYIVLALSIAYAFTFPMYGDIGALMDKKQSYQDSLANVAMIETKKNALKETFNSIPEEQKKEIQTLLPDSPQFVLLVSQIDAIAAKYGISIDNITSKEQNQSLPGSISEGAVANPYQTTTIGFNFVTTYENFLKFVDDLEKSLRILDISTARLISQNMEGRATSLYNFTVEFDTYWFK